jgi:sterol desaturase/sphingolipid hydroxylase (fatty acid hydroxylase superfamily)
VLFLQFLIVLYHYYNVFYALHPSPVHINFDRSVSQKNFWRDLRTHVCNPEGFLLLGSYLCFTWMFRIMPESYYSYKGGISLSQFLQQLVLTDFLQTLMHLAEHHVSPRLYQLSHKPHHRFISPKLFDAFDGSLCDTFLMILVPLALTAQVVHCNVWTYMLFGSVYAAFLTLIHSEFEHVWDPFFKKFKIGTPSDHHVHHAKFCYNFGHMFMWWDMLLGTYRNPVTVKQFYPSR